VNVAPLLPSDDDKQGGADDGHQTIPAEFHSIRREEHLRSEIEATGGSPDLTKSEIELVRFIYEGSFDWARSWPSVPAPDEEGGAGHALNRN
jgi:hypothetical protein